MAVADDQLALPTADGNHRIDRFDPGLQWFTHRLPVDYPWRAHLHTPELLGLNRPLSVQWQADGIHDPPDHCFADRHFRNAAGPLDRIAFLDVDVGAENHGADIVLFQI